MDMTKQDKVAQGENGWSGLLVVIRMTVVLMLVCGLLYNLVVTGIAQLVMPHRAEGSLLYNNEGEVIGSALIGQAFASPQWFHGRVSSIDYAADGSGSPNYAPSNPDLELRVQESIRSWGADNPDVPTGDLPIDLITNSASGLDPHISVEAAIAQIPRVSKWSGLSEEQLHVLVSEHTADRELGVFGEPVVHVLKLNLELEKKVNSAASR